MQGLVYKNIYIIKNKLISIMAVGIGLIIIFELLLLSVRYGNLKTLFPDIEEVQQSLIQPSYAIAGSMFLLPAVLFEVFIIDKSAGFKNIQYSMPVSPKDKVCADYICFYGFIVSIFAINIAALQLYLATAGTAMHFKDLKTLYLIFAAASLAYGILIPSMYIDPKGLAVILGGAYLVFGCSMMFDDGRTMVKAAKKIYALKGTGMAVSFIVVVLAAVFSLWISVLVEKRRYRKC